MRRAPLTFVLVAACGGGSNHGTDGSIDAPPGGKTFHISGTASQQGGTGTSTPAAGVVVAAFASANENTPVTMATTDAMGKYSLTVNSPTTTLDGFLKATKMGNVDTYLYPPAPLTMDFMNASVNELDTNLFAALNGNGLGAASCMNSASQAIVVLEVFDTAMMPVAGVTVTVTPAASKVGYTAATGLPVPDYTGTATQPDGRAYLCGLPAGAVTLTGTKTGVTFKTTMAKAHPGALTTTLITQ